MMTRQAHTHSNIIMLSNISSRSCLLAEPTENFKLGAHARISAQDPFGSGEGEEHKFVISLTQSCCSIGIRRDAAATMNYGFSYSPGESVHPST